MDCAVSHTATRREVTKRVEVNFKLRLRHQGDCVAFAEAIRQAVVERMARNERFSAVRLRNATLVYDDFICWREAADREMRGYASESGITVRQTESAIQLAGTVLHELAHITVGARDYHSRNWHDACEALGLMRHEPGGQEYTPDDFATEIRAAIAAAIHRFAKENPALVVRGDVEIPWPAHVGIYTCPDYHPGENGCRKHRLHIMEFQIAGIRRMLEIAASGRGILLADDMGLGKTVETIGFINATHPERILVVCPNSVKLIWRNHFRDFCVHDYDVEVAYARLYTFGDVVIMNYETAVRWGDALRKQDWDLVVYDEGHYIKTPSAQRSRTCYAIKGRQAIIITGTPITNYYFEAFPLLHYLDGERWYSASAFEASYGSRDHRFGRNLNRLQAILRETIMVRRTKKEVLSQLPKKRRVLVEFETDEEIRKLIEEEKRLFDDFIGAQQAQALSALRNESEADDDTDWAALIEALITTKRYAFEEMARIAHKIGLAKIPFVLDHLENVLEAREKVAVFGYHRDVLTRIAGHFKPHSVLLLGGNADQAEMALSMAQKFSDDPECRVFVAQVRIAEGYSLGAGSTVCFVEQDWKPGLFMQAEDRMHGLGRGDQAARSLLVQHLLFEDSLDTHKAKLVNKKARAIERAIG